MEVPAAAHDDQDDLTSLYWLGLLTVLIVVVSLTFWVWAMKNKCIEECSSCGSRSQGWVGPHGIYFCNACWVAWGKENDPVTDISAWISAGGVEKTDAADGAEEKAEDTDPPELASKEDVTTKTDDWTETEWKEFKEKELKAAEGTPSITPPLTSELVSELRLLTTSYDRTVKLWCARTGACLRTFVGHTDAVMYSVLSPDGASVLTAAYDGLAKIWSIATGECTHTFDGRKDAFSEFHGLYSAVFSADATRVLTASADGGARIWRVTDCTCEWVVQGCVDIYMRQAIFSPSETHILTASADHSARLFEVESRTLEKTFSGHTGWLNTACFSEDGSLVLTSSADSTARLWSVLTGRTVSIFRGHTHFVRSAVFATPGHVLTCSSDWSSRLWSIRNNTCLRVFTGHVYWVNSAVASSDGHLMVTASRDHTIKLWRMDTGACELTMGTVWAEEAPEGQQHVDFVSSAIFVPRLTPGSRAEPRRPGAARVICGSCLRMAARAAWLLCNKH